MLAVTVVGFSALYNGVLAVYLHKAAYNVLHPDEDNEAGEAAETGAGMAGGSLR